MALMKDRHRKYNYSKFISFVFLLCFSSQVFADLENWERFKTRFISAEGRVIDTGNGHISHSEGQGAGMLLAVAYDDQDTFERIWAWTDKNLGIRDDGLFVWRWDPNKDLHTEDFGSASDGDIFIAWAMARAAKKWENPTFLKNAKQLAKTIRTQLVADVYGDTLLLPGPVWPRRDGHTVINLSYWIYPAFQELGEIDPSPEWEKLIRTGIDLMTRAKFGDWDLPADWIAVKNDGSLSQLDDFSFVFGYEAVRIPLYYLWGGYKQKDLLRVYQAFWSTTAKGNKLVTILGLALDSIIQQENVLAYSAVSELVECAISQEPVSVLTKSFSDYEDYYSAVLFLIAQRVVEESMPYCRAEETGKDTKPICTEVGDPNCPISDPIHAKIEKGELIVRVEDFIQIPPTKLRRPLARIKSLTHTNDKSGRIFVIDEDGKIFLIKDGQLQLEPFLDIARIRGNHFFSDNEDVGIRSIAFHPDFSTPDTFGFQHFYTVHSERADSPSMSADTPIFTSSSNHVNHYDVISEWRVDANNPDKAMPGSQRELMRIAQPRQYNNVGQIGFDLTMGKDDPEFGLLYISVGDGGEANTFNAQDRSNLFGKILRIDPQLGKKKGGYGVPKNNPFMGGEKNILPEIWAYGFDNPWQFSWDPENGKMFIVDAGRKNIEEVNIGKPGANYGWNHREGTFAAKYSDESNVFPLPVNDAVWNFTYPVLQYDLDEGKSIIGGFVYRGRLIPELHGHYVFADFLKGRIFYTDVNNLPMDQSDMSLDVSKKIHEMRLFYKGAEKNILEILNYDSRADLSLGVDEEGEIYILTKRDGMIRRLLSMPSENTN